MIEGTKASVYKQTIAASWERCERKHNLLRDAARPILRLQSSEIAPRLEQIVERTGGRQGIIRHLASVAGEVGHCLVVTDAEGVLVRLETGAGQNGVETWNGITLGSCWDERIAGTNGVTMALQTGQAFTVRGADHYYAKLRQFACTGVPVLDAEGAMVGAVNLVSIDRGNRADYLFGQQLLATAARRIQRNLFEKHFADAMLVTLSRAGPDNVLSDDALIAVDEAGIILGATSSVEPLIGDTLPRTLKGQAFEAIFDVESQSLAHVPDRVLSMPMPKGPALTLKVRLPGVAKQQRAALAMPQRQKRLPPSLRQLATGSTSMAAACKQAARIFDARSPLLLEGETGTGKSALIAALLEAEDADAPVFRIDCATFGETESDREHLQFILEQARVLATMSDDHRRAATLVFDNVDEMPKTAQAELRRYLDELEDGLQLLDNACAAGMPRILATSKTPLGSAVHDGQFRDDLYYLLTKARVILPPLRSREHPALLAQVLAARIAGRTIDFSEEAIAAILAHGFPGNVRELRSALERALMTARSDRITPVELQDTSILQGGLCAVPVDRASGTAPKLVYDERTLILDALTSCRWNVSEAARKLGMGRATINRKMKAQGISRPT